MPNEEVAVTTAMSLAVSVNLRQFLYAICAKFECWFEVEIILSSIKNNFERFISVILFP